jgi:hypothetical protein
MYPKYDPSFVEFKMFNICRATRWTRPTVYLGFF